MVTDRTQICDALLAVLTGLPTTGGNAFLWDGHKLEAASLPCVLIKMGNESNAYASADQPRHQKRILSLEVKCIGKASSGLQPLINIISAEVEDAIDKSLYLGGLLFALDLEDSGWSIDGEAEQPHAAWSLSYQATYFKQEGAIPAVPMAAITDVRASLAPDIGLGSEPAYVPL